MKHPLYRYLAHLYSGKAYSTHEGSRDGAIQVGGYSLTWLDESTAPTADDILSQIETLDPVIDEIIAAEES